MPYPSAYTQTYSYTAFQQSQGNNSFPGTQMDADLAGVSTAIAGLQTFIQTTLRSDGALQNGCVTLDKLSSDIQLGIPVPTVWAAAATYVVGQTVTEGATLYIALVAHTSTSSFATDYGNGLWRTVATFSTSSVAPDNSVDTNALVDGAVTSAKIASGAVSGASIADGGVSAAKFAAKVGIVPIGGVISYDGLTLPSGYRWCDGTAYARVGSYADLFAALTATSTATSNSGSDTLTGMSADWTGLGVVGAVVEHAGFPAGVTIVSLTATTVKLSDAATSNSTSTARVLPHGAGDGSTTFNVPDRRGRSDIARDDLGGTAATRLTTLAGIGRSGGEEKHALTIPELAAHSHGTTDAGHSHGVTDPGHVHPLGHSTTGYAAGLGPTYNPMPTDANTQSATTGVSINSGTTGVTINSAGSGTAHNNLQPSYVCNKIIFAGV